MRDEIIKAVSGDGFVSLTAVTSRVMAERARDIHGASPVATAALGRAMSATAMMGAALKSEDTSVTVRINGGGPLGTMIAVSDCCGNTRAWAANPAADLPSKPNGKLDVGGAVGSSGTLTVIRDMRGEAPYVGTVALVSGEIAEDFTAYFAVSEQTPAACALGVLVGTDRSVLASGGYIARLLPGAPPELAEALETNVANSGAVTPMLLEGGADMLIERVMFGLGARTIARAPVEYRCYCTRARVIDAIAGIGRAEIEDIRAKGEQIEVKCRFCDASYRIGTDELT
ncbi:MAG: Hsp33 family molecular chaperone HslO [Oscillospiraceae bacterium]|jgi:molecular chaperone Hsp33|nr:Hsp33 family molecular chaperone HslO [Oscillospiraceae bacterium]